MSKYTREAGVRSLERRIGALCRSVAVEVAEGRRGDAKAVLGARDVERILGVSKEEESSKS